MVWGNRGRIRRKIGTTWMKWWWEGRTSLYRWRRWTRGRRRVMKRIISLTMVQLLNLVIGS